MKIEVLYPEVCHLYGDLTSIEYLKMCAPEIEVINTDLKSRPKFLDEEIDLVYMGSTTERGLELSCAALINYKDEIKEKIDNGQRMLIVGNALDIFGESIVSDDGLDIKGLGILKTHAQYQMYNRHNSFYLGKFGEMDIVGFKSLFGHTYGANEENGLFETVRGIGRNKDTKIEGFHINNFMATYLTGPFLILNPIFTKYLLNELGLNIEKLAFEEENMDAYKVRLAEFNDPNKNPYF